MLPEKKDHNLLIFLVLFNTGLSYSNSLSCSWHLDDIINILTNTRLHLNVLSMPDIVNTFFAYPTDPGRFYRPVSCLSFALNWFLSGNKVSGYHIVNISIHLLTTFFLFKSTLLLHKSPRLKGKYCGSELTISALATLLWAVNPVQTQAVTYIVQRMASMAALFSILGLYFFISYRIKATNQKEKIAYITLIIISFFLAMGSKENSIIFPFSILLIEFIFFTNSAHFIKKRWLPIVGIILTVCFFSYILAGKNIFGVLNGYQHRTFTLPERLLTESRIVCWYLSLLFYPSITRLSIEHDIQLSTSFFVPVSTSLSLTFLLILFISSSLGFRKHPIPAFAILFFFLNHIVESTFLPLELIFEHRNYLPSLFLFWPLAIFMVHLLNNYKKQIIMHSFLIICFSLLVCSLAIGTYIRNQVWYSEKSLWSDAVIKAPNSMRALLDLGYTYEQENDLATAVTLDRKALGKKSPTLEKFTVNAYNNIGNIMRKMGRYQDALFWLNKGLEIEPKNDNILFVKFMVQQAEGNSVEAKKTLNLLLTYFPHNRRYLIDYANIEINEGSPDKAMETLHKALSITAPSDPSYWQILLSLALAANKIHQFQKATFFLNLAHTQGAPNFLVDLCALENQLLINSEVTILDPLIQRIFYDVPLTQLHERIVFGPDNISDIAYDKNLIFESIDQWIQRKMLSAPAK